MTGNVLFGDWGWGPRALDPDVEYGPTPVGVPCLWCGEPIRDGDVGEFMPVGRSTGTTIEPAHRECLMLGVIGHEFGVCHCTDYAGHGDDRRAAALELARRVDNMTPP